MPHAKPLPSVNRQVTLAARPNGIPQESDFKLQESPMPEPGRGEALVQSLYLSVDPHIRARLNGTANYTKGLRVGDVMMGGVVGRVISSHDPRVAPGDIVEGMLGWQEFATAPARSLRRIDPSVAPISTALYVLGTPGLTAYFGLLEICKPQQGESVVISGAAGAVGSLVGQIAKIKRCRVFGIAGTPEKVDFLVRELGFDGAVNYRETPDLSLRIKELTPNGVDVYFDNVGGDVTDHVVRQLSTGARIGVCGQISQLDNQEPEVGPRWLGQLVLKQARAEGFLVQQFADRFDAALHQLATWLREEKLRYRQEIMNGLENAPAVFISMLRGAAIGKQLIQVAAE